VHQAIVDLPIEAVTTLTKSGRLQNRGVIADDVRHSCGLGRRHPQEYAGRASRVAPTEYTPNCAALLS
jgi:hypothetical protein